MIGTTGSKWGTREKSRTSAKGASVERVHRKVSFNSLLKFGADYHLRVCNKSPPSRVSVLQYRQYAPLQSYPAL